MEKIKKESIVSIKIRDKFINNSYIYIEESFKKRFFGLLKDKHIKAGFRIYNYLCHSESVMTEEDILKHEYYTIEDKKVYHKPMLTIELINGNTKEIYFNTLKEAINLATQLTKGLNFEQIKQ